VKLIRDICAPSFLTVTPGIRPEGSDIGDQKRVMTPRQAKEAGVDYMVIGRPITQNPQPSDICGIIVNSF
jgi:orotidine-5'-phosphate decarboxylase